MLKFDVRAFLTRFGGPEAVHYGLKAAGFKPPSVAGIRHWRRENRMSTDRVAQLAALAERQGAPVDLNDYLKPDITAETSNDA